MLKQRLGLETTRIPHADRHGLLWLEQGQLRVRHGTLCYACTGRRDMPAGTYDLPFQMLSLILLGPGTSLTHDVLRLCARHGTGICAVGRDGVRLYTFPPLGRGASALAREQVRRWHDRTQRLNVARKMYAWRLGEFLPQHDIEALRGVEGARLREDYARLAREAGVAWDARRHNRNNPDATDAPNQAINHVAAAVQACAAIAVAAAGAIPQLGFIHEDSAQAFVLDVADLYRTELTLPVAFKAVRQEAGDGRSTLEQTARRLAGRAINRGQVISRMIDRIKELFPCP